MNDNDERCVVRETGFSEETERQCVRDVGHTGRCEFGPWRPSDCAHDWQEQPGEPPVDVCSSCGAVRE